MNIVFGEAAPPISLMNGRFIRTGFLPEAVIAGWSVERSKGWDGFLAKPPYTCKSECHFFAFAGDTKARFTSLASTYSLTKDKVQVEELLSAAGLKVAKSRYFRTSESHAAIEWVRHIGWPIVVKPRFGSMGRGVTASIESWDELESAIREVSGAGFLDGFLVQPHIHGQEYRLLSSRTHTTAAYRRIPSHVVGTGKHTIRELVRLANEVRSINPHLGAEKRRIVLDSTARDFLKKADLRPTSIPDEGQIVWLSTLGNTHSGASTVDVTDELAPAISELGARSVAQIPGLEWGSVDIIVRAGNDSLSKEVDYVILEVNATPGVGGHLYPMYGTPRNVCREMIQGHLGELGLESLEVPELVGVIAEVQGSTMTVSDVDKLLSQVDLNEVRVDHCAKTIKFFLDGRAEEIAHVLLLLLNVCDGTFRAVRTDAVERDSAIELPVGGAIPGPPVFANVHSPSRREIVRRAFQRQTWRNLYKTFFF